MFDINKRNFWKSYTLLSHCIYSSISVAIKNNVYISSTETIFLTDENPSTAFEYYYHKFHWKIEPIKGKAYSRQRLFHHCLLKRSVCIIIGSWERSSIVQLIAHSIALTSISNDHRLVGSINLNLFNFPALSTSRYGQLASSSWNL